jgi:SAM-dependent methyltransferase
MSHIDPWESGLPYEPFMGRWSRKIAPLFLNWLNSPDRLRWLDVGCGTGASSSLIAQETNPQEVLGIDPSAAFVDFANSAAQNMPLVHFQVAGAEDIPAADHYFDIAISALALNFFTDPAAGLREMSRVVKPGGDIAVYVWDYAEGMQMLRYFWDVVVALDPAALTLDEKVRFPICRPDALKRVFMDVGLNVREIQALETPTVFQNFDDYWRPFLGGVGPAPGYVASLGSDERAKLRDRLREALPHKADGTIPLIARAWAIRGTI